MKSINISQKDYEKLCALIKEHDQIFGNEDTVWSFQDLTNLQEIGTEIVNILTPLVEITDAEIVLDSE